MAKNRARSRSTSVTASKQHTAGYRQTTGASAPVFLCAPGRARSLGGASPLLYSLTKDKEAHADTLAVAISGQLATNPISPKRRNRLLPSGVDATVTPDGLQEYNPWLSSEEADI